MLLPFVGRWKDTAWGEGRDRKMENMEKKMKVEPAGGDEKHK